MLIIVRYTNTLTDLLTYKQTDKQTNRSENSIPAKSGEGNRQHVHGMLTISLRVLRQIR